MARLILLALALCSATAWAQGDPSLILPPSGSILESAFTIEATPAVIEARSRIEEIKTVAFEGFEFSKEVRPVSERKDKAPAVRLKLTAPAIEVSAYRAGDLSNAQVYEISRTDFLVVGDPGRYLVVVDTADRTKVRPIDIVALEPSPGDPPPDPKPPTDPTDPPVGEYSSLTTLARELAEGLNDAPTRAALASALAAPTGATDLAGAIAAVNRSIEGALLARKGESLKVDWLNGWRRPVDKAIIEKGVTTLAQYEAAIAAVRAGLVISPLGVEPLEAYELREVFETVCAPDGSCTQVRRLVRVRVR